MTVNKVILIGNIGSDPEISQVGESTKARLSIATSDVWKDKSTGEKKENTQWHNIVFWNKNAEIIQLYAKKGHLLYIEGKLEKVDSGTRTLLISGVTVNVSEDARIEGEDDKAISLEDLVVGYPVECKGTWTGFKEFSASRVELD